MPTEPSPSDIVPVEDAENFWDDPSAVLACLQEIPPRIPAYLGYDATGSELFESITELPNYYLTAVEQRLLQSNADEIAAEIAAGRVAELGSGSAKKTQVLLAAYARRRATTYLPIDVSREMLETSTRGLTRQLPELRVQALWGRYEAGLAHVRAGQRERLVVVLLGSTLGNTTPAERNALLSEVAATLRPGDGFLVSADLSKLGKAFEACYNDPPDGSAFARFRLNYLTHLNRLFDGNFALEYFYPRAHYEPHTGTVVAYLYATEDQSVALRRLNLAWELQRGDRLNVGIAHKFHRPQLVTELAAWGLDLRKQWIDAVWQYGLFLFARDV